jgi:chorismate synthase
MVALVVADAVLEKFGGDSVGETKRNSDAYLKHVAERGLSVASGAGRA